VVVGELAASPWAGLGVCERAASRDQPIDLNDLDLDDYDLTLEAFRYRQVTSTSGQKTKWLL
jgi:hypothetical protein